MRELLFSLLGLVVGIVGILVLIKFKPILGAKKLEEKIAKSLQEAKEEAVKITSQAEIEGQKVVEQLKREALEEIKESKKNISFQEEKLSLRETNLDRRDNILLSKEENIERKLKQIEDQDKQLNQREKQLEEESLKITKELERISRLSEKSAKEELFKIVEEKNINEITQYLKEQEEEAKSKASKRAKEFLVESLEKYSQEVTTEKTVSVVDLPNDELKGRIIGREGRNIKVIEQLTGVDLIIDDTPEVISVSCFDPIRREIAKLTLQYLIKDGRIQPGRIEEVVEKAKNEIDEIMFKAGEDAIFELNIAKMAPEIIKTIGKLKYRTSYGQNALKHSMEVAHLTGIMAKELGLDEQLAKRAGLLHDLGKGLDFEVEGTHVELGSKLAKKYNEQEEVINAIESHHGDTPSTSLIATLVASADTLSAARPGARSESLENYIKRLEQLESISKSFDGVAQAYAIQAGREVRIMVIPNQIDDNKAYKLAKDVREKIENEMTYPGQIKVVVIRETRASEVAK